MWNYIPRLLKLLIFSGILLRPAYPCNFPTNLASKTWLDSDKGELVFTTNQMTGWDFSSTFPFTTLYTPTWECYNTTTSGSDTILIVRSTATIVYLGSTSRPFLCMRLRQITDVSYYYYLQWGEQIQLDYERITMVTDAIVSSISDPFESLCLNNSVASLSDSEYHVLVENGTEAQAIQDCPSELYQLYTYTITDANSSTIACNGGTSRLDMCSDVKRMTFDYTLCSDTAAYSANGSLFCLVTLTSGSNILHTMYNEDASVDNINTFRFTCFMSSVAADGSVSMSVSPGSCTRTQTPNDQPTSADGSVYIGNNMNLAPIPSVLTCDFPCTMPSFLANTNWTDSDKGTLHFTSDSMVGWDFYEVNNLVSPTWKCFHTTTSGDSTILILRSDSALNAYNDIFRPFICLQLNQISDVSYYYYLLWVDQAQLGYERITMIRDVNESLISDPYNELCLNSSMTAAFLPEHEYHIIIREGSESSAKVDCPSSFYGIYAYTVEDKDTGTSFCTYNDTQWDVCTDYQRMTINYTHCTTTVAYSAGGALFCVFSLTVGSTVIHTVYNEDVTVDNTNTHRFTCFMSTVSSDGNLTVSQAPRSCTKDQTITDQPTLSNGTVVGLNLYLAPFENGLCPVVVPTSDSSSTNTIVIVSSVLGSLFLLGIIGAILTCFFCKVCCFKRAAKVDAEPNNNTVDKKMKDTDGKEKHIPEGSGIVESSSVAHKEPCSSVDIASLSHVRTYSRLDTPIGLAPEDTQFWETKKAGEHNSFTLPLLQGKSPRSPSARSRLSGYDESLLQSGSLSVSDMDTARFTDRQPIVQMVGSTSSHTDNNIGHAHIGPIPDKNTVAPVITENGISSGCTVEKQVKDRKKNELPDNSVIISSHFQKQNMSYMNKFMDLPRKQTVGPDNDHDFREKRTYSEKVVSIAKANTVLDIMSKGSGLQTFGKSTTKANANNKKTDDASYLLERSKTFGIYKNKTGEFRIESSPQPSSDGLHMNNFLDDTNDGIAYDDDNQRARKHVHFSTEDDLLRELTQTKFKYGTVSRENGVTKEADKTAKDTNETSTRNNDIENEPDSDEEREEIDDEDDAKEASFEMDNPSLHTAMSVLYSENEDDPDKMSIRGYEL